MRRAQASHPARACGLLPQMMRAFTAAGFGHTVSSEDATRQAHTLRSRQAVLLASPPAFFWTSGRSRPPFRWRGKGAPTAD